MKFLRVIATLNPRHGGPSAGLRAITPVLDSLGHHTTFATLDAPGCAENPPGNASLFELGPAHGGFAFAPKLEPWLRENVASYDAVFVHGLWQHHGRTVRRVLRSSSIPYFVFPHGMLDPWFRRAYPAKHVKKWVYWQLCERHVLRDAAAVLFTCEEERRLARSSFKPYACRERVIEYGTAAPKGDPGRERSAWRLLMPQLADQPFWLFLGRLHPKKGADILLRAYGELGKSSAAPLPTLVLAGPFSDDRHRAELEQLAAQLPGHCRAFFPGMLDGDAKWGALRAAEIFVLPSHQENFGIAVVEALAVGTPVLISRKVNIWDAIESHRAGLIDTDDVPGTLRLLRQWLAMTADKRAEMRRAASEIFMQRYEIGRVARSLVASVSPFLANSPLPHDELTQSRV